MIRKEGCEDNTDICSTVNLCDAAYEALSEKVFNTKWKADYTCKEQAFMKKQITSGVEINLNIDTKTLLEEAGTNTHKRNESQELKGARVQM